MGKLINRQNKKGGLWLPKNSSRVCSEHFTAGKPTDDNPDPVLKLGYERKLQSKRKLPAERTEPPVKRPKTCLECLLEPDEQETTNIELVSIDVTTIPNKETGVVNTTNTVVSEEKDTCDYVGDHGMVESSRKRPHHVTHDHSYCDGQFEMEEIGCCVNEPCLKRMKKDEEIVTLKNAVYDLTQKS